MGILCYKNIDEQFIQRFIMRYFSFFILAVSFLLVSCQKSPQDASLREKTHFDKGYRYEKNGWVFIHAEGKPYEIGLQQGYLLADRFKEAIRVYTYMSMQLTGMDYSFFVDQAVKLHKKKIPEEYIKELQGMADGLTKAGVPSSLEDLIGWNSYVELTSNWWPLHQSNFASYVTKNMSPKEKCSAFIATGSATKDGKIVMGHTTFDDFWNAPFDNVILDLVPSKGARILMQTQPCYLSSMEDFFITGAGLVGVETTIAGFSGYDETKTPEYIRARLGMQYGVDIDSFVELMTKDDDGGVAAVWLIGDINKNEIAQFQEGLIFHKLDKKTEGTFFGANVAFDPRIRNLECSGMGYNDVRRQTGARRVRWPVVLDTYKGDIDAENGKRMLADHYDVYKKKFFGSARTICGHYDKDPRYNMSSEDAVWPDPFTPAGSIDGKVTTADLAKEMKMWARFGRACGTKFEADKFLKEHPQWDWQKDVLVSRPSEPWVLFSGE